MFKETKSNPPGYFDQYIDKIGGKNNAYTSMDATVYYEDIPINGLEKVLGFEAQRMSELTLNPKTFESERQVVLEERKMRYENSPSGKLYLNLIKKVFSGTPYGYSVIGEVEDLNKINRDNVFEYYKNYYAPNNATIVVVGDVDPSKVYKIIKDKFGPLKYSKRVDKIKKIKDQAKLFPFTQDSKVSNFGKSFSLKGQSPTPIFAVGLKGAAKGTKKALIYDLVTAMIGGGQSSYLFKKYVYSKKPVLNNIAAFNYALKFNGLMFIWGELRAQTSLKDFKKQLYTDFAEACNKSMTPRNFQKAKNQFLISYYGDMQTNAGVAKIIGEGEYFHGDYNYFKKELALLEQIKLQEIKESCLEAFKKENSIFVDVWSKNK